MSACPYLIALLLSIVCASDVPVGRLDVESKGLEGNLTAEQRYADAVGTDLQVYANGPALKNSVLNTSPNGVLSEVHRNALRNISQECDDDRDIKKCELAINGFGGVGEVQYNFSNGIENVHGRSTQVNVACRCVGEECRTAVLIRPVNVFENLPANEEEKPVSKTCLYEAVEKGFSDCHHELLRIVRRPVWKGLEYTHGEDFNYTVNEEKSQSKWTAKGQRGWTRDCLLSDVNSLPTATMAEIENITKNTHTTSLDVGSVVDNGCKPRNSRFQYYVEKDEAAGAACYATYEYASAAASVVGSRDDDHAIGLKQETYLFAKPPLVSDTELALTCSAAGLGVLVLCGIYRKRRRNANRFGFFLFRVVMIQVLTYALESLPLHIALYQETFARGWETEFSHVGGSLALASDQLVPQGCANGSVLVMTAVLGTVKYKLTRVALVAAFTAAFDLTAVVIVILTVLTRRGPELEAEMAQPPPPEHRYGGWMRYMRRFPPRESEESRWKRLEMEGRFQLQQMANVGQNGFTGYMGWDSNAVTGMGSESTVSDGPIDMDIGADAVPSTGHAAHVTDTAIATTPEQAVAGGNGSHTSQEGMGEVEDEHQNDDPNSRQ